MKKSKKFINKLAFSLAAAVLCAVAAVALVFTPGTAAYADETYAVYLFYNSDYTGGNSYNRATSTFTSVNAVYHSMRYNHDGYVVQSGFTIDHAMHVDLNGCRLKGSDINVTGGTVVFEDLKGHGYFNVDVKSGGTAEYRGNTYTLADLAVYNDGTLKVYSGQINSLICTDGTIYNEHRITQVLPEGYAFVAHYKNGGGSALWSYASANNKDTYSTNDSGETIDYLTVQKCSHTSITGGVCMFCNATVDGTEALKTAREDLATAKAELEAAIAAKADTATLNEKVTELNTAIKNAEKASKEYADTKDTALKDELTQLINDGDSALQTAIDAVSTNLNQAKTELETKIKTNADDLLAAKDKYDKEVVAIKKLISDIQTTDTTQGEAIKQLQTDLAAAESDLQTQITNAISKAESDLATAKSELNAAIAKKADATALASAITDYDKKISDINGLITAIQGVNTTQDEAIKQLQTDLAAAKTDLEGKITAAAAKANEDLATAKSELETAIAKKADATALANAITDYNKKISDINDLITAIQGVNTTQGEAIKQLQTDLAAAKTDLEGKITAAAAKANEDLATAKSELETAIAKKADATALANAITDYNKKISDINDLITAIQGVNTTQGEAIKQLQTDLAAAKTDLEGKITAAAAKANEDLTKAKSDLNAAIAKKADATALASAITDYNKKISDINDLITAIQGVNTTQGEEIENLKTALNDAKTDLEGKITAAAAKANEDLTKAKSELNAAIAKKANADDVKAKLAALQTALDNANATIGVLQDNRATKSELESSVSQAKTEVGKAASDALAAAKSELNAAIDAKADADVVNEKIAVLSHAVENAQAISDASTDKKDEAVKLELQSGIKNAKDALQAAIDALAARVDKAEARIDENAGEIKNLKNIMYLSLGVLFVVGVIVILMCAAMRCTIKAGMGKNGKNK